VADQRAPVHPDHLDAEPVGRPAGRRRVHAGRDRHLLQRGGVQDAAGVAEQEGAEPAEVGQRRPQLPGRGHHAGVVLGLGEDDVGPGVHRRALGGRGHRAWARAGHAQRAQHLGGDGVVPGRAAQPGDELAEQAEPQVRIVEATGRAEDDVVLGEREVVQ
jgi:hypothetical protein